jgi:hypothetical protein
MNWGETDETFAIAGAAWRELPNHVSKATQLFAFRLHRRERSIPGISVA